MNCLVCVKFKNYEMDFDIEIPDQDADADDIPEDVLEEILDNTGLLSDAFSDHIPKAIGYFTEESAEDAVCNSAVDYINALGDKLPVSVYQVDDENHHRLIHKYNIKEAVLNCIYDEKQSGEFASRASGYIEDCLQTYVSESSWHVLDIPGKEKPVLWFGPTEKVENPCWQIDLNKDVDLSFWFEDNQWSLMHYIGITDDQCFLVWYFDECGCTVPDIEAVRKACPVKLEENDTAESILARL